MTHLWSIIPLVYGLLLANSVKGDKAIAPVAVVVGETLTDIRLRGGPSSMFGRLEIQIDGVWGTVCDDGFDANAAEVTCRQLGFAISSSEIRFFSDLFLASDKSLEYFLDELSCTGSEESLANCSHNDYGIHDCSFTETVSVDCSGDEYVLTGTRLTGTESHLMGRLEIAINGVWGTFCDDHFTESVLSVICLQLGSEARPESFNIKESGKYSSTETELPIWFNEVECDGNETTITDCTYSPIGNAYCTHSEDVNVDCGDVNECILGLDDCQQDCTNTVGSYFCSCKRGWDLNDDRTTCSRQIPDFEEPELCEPGNYSESLNGRAPCTLCPKGQYQNETGKDFCYQCMDDMSTALPGSTSVGDCIPLCPVGTYGVGGLPPCMMCPADSKAEKLGSEYCTSCCYGSYYNIQEEFCCNYRVFKYSEWDGCCGGPSGGRVYRKTSWICCDGNVVSTGWNSTDCCGPHSYNSMYHLCCHGAVKPLDSICK